MEEESLLRLKLFLFYSIDVLVSGLHEVSGIGSRFWVCVCGSLSLFQAPCLRLFIIYVISGYPRDVRGSLLALSSGITPRKI